MINEERIFLEYFVDSMEKEGLVAKALHISFTEEELSKINKMYSVNISLEKMQEILNKLLSHEYIKHATFGSRFSNLEITAKGVGVVNSLRRQDETKKSKSTVKKLSDYVEEHKGLFLAFGFLLALVTLILKLQGN